jgi:hypothetical protein
LSTVILDTHVFAWGLDNYRRVNRVASERIQAADTVWVSPISFYEIGQKVRLGKWPEMAAFVDRLQVLAEAEGGRWRHSHSSGEAGLVSSRPFRPAYRRYRYATEGGAYFKRCGVRRSLNANRLARPPLVSLTPSPPAP